MNHKRKLLSAAVLLSLGAGQAAALPLSDYDATTLDVYISGASAQDQGLESMMRRLCEANTLDIYRGTSGSNQRMMFCRITSTNVPGFPAAPGRKVLLHKSSVGGSGNGVQPVADASQLAFMTQASTCPAPVGQPAQPGLPAYGLSTCTANVTANAVPHAGLSDVEPALLGATPTQNARLEVASANALIFGVPVSRNLRDELQRAQGLPAGSDLEADMPTLTKGQLTSMFAGGITDWNQLSDQSGISLTDPAGLTLNPPADTRVFIARRVGTSGTQATFNANFLNFPCATGVLPMVPGNDGGSCGTNTVNEGSGTSNVLNCLTTHNTANRWAVGMASMENVPAAAAGWRFVKINGQAPTLLNVAESRYDLYAEQTIQWRNATAPSPLSGEPLALMQKVRTDLGDPVVVNSLNNAFIQNPGVNEWYTGLMALITNGWVPTDPAAAPVGPLTAAEVRANPVNTNTRSPSGTTNNCQVPVTFFPTGAIY